MTLVNSFRDVWGQVRRQPGPTPAPPPNPELAAFLKAGQEEAADRKAATVAVSSWGPIEPGDDRATAKKLGRGLVWFVLGLLALVGLRALIAPNHSDPAPKSAPTVAGSGFPEGQAQAVAQRWTTNYLAFDSQSQDAADTREQALAQDTAPDVDLASSWNDAGAQRVVSVLPGQVHATSKTAATVTVYAQVAAGANSTPAPSSTTPAPTPKSSATPKSKPKSTAPAKTKQKAAAGLDGAQVVPAALSSSSSAPLAAGTDWIGLTIPVGWDGQRVVVTGLPAFVGLPKAGTVHQDQAKEQQADTALSTATRSGAEAFFRAYAGADADALQAVAAPGAKLAPLGGQIEFAGMQNWTVYQDANAADSSAPSTAKPGVSATRAAQAVVVWQLAGGAQLTQAYDVRLENVTGSGASAWRVANVSVNSHITQ